MLERQDIRAVVSAIPIHLHARNYLDVIAASKDLYAEKPLAMTVAECNAVAKAASSGDSVVMVGMQRRANPRVLQAVAAVHGGELGDLIEGRIQWSNVYGPMGGWYGRKHQSGDWMLEQACHNWDVMNWVNQCRPALAVGLGRNDLFRNSPVVSDQDRKVRVLQPDRDVHDYYSAVVEYENGVLVNILHSWISPPLLSGEFTRIVGTRGGVDFNQGTFSYRPDQQREDRTLSVELDRLERDAGALRAFLASVRSRKPPPATVGHGREAALTSMLVREAVYRRQPVTMKELLAAG
jgi:predicted dehydrogenase